MLHIQSLCTCYTSTESHQRGHVWDVRETRLEDVSSDRDVIFKAKGKAGPQAAGEALRREISRLRAELVTVEAPGRPAPQGWSTRWGGCQVRGRHGASARAPSAQPTPPVLGPSPEF